MGGLKLDVFGLHLRPCLLLKVLRCAVLATIRDAALLFEVSEHRLDGLVLAELQGGASSATQKGVQV